jgi:16S rRNA (cytosine967-C5)-methyltransferase
VKAGGVLAYATCSVLSAENAERTRAFLREHPQFSPLEMADAWRSALPDVEPPAVAIAGPSLCLSPRRTRTDGFFLSLLRREG